MSQLSIHLRADGITVVNAPAMLDASTAPELRKAFVALAAAEGTPLIVVDCGAVEFVDSMGLGVLYGGQKRAKAKGGRFVLADVPERIHKALRVTGLLKLIDVHESASAACDAFNGGSAAVADV